MVKIADLLGLTYQGISQLNSGHNPMGTHKARQLEGALGLPVGWFDHEDLEIPPATLELLAASSSPSALAQAVAAAAKDAPGGEAKLSSALHQAVLDKFVALARAKRISDQQAYELLGKLLEFDRAAPALSA